MSLNTIESYTVKGLQECPGLPIGVYLTNPDSAAVGDAVETWKIRFFESGLIGYDYRDKRSYLGLTYTSHTTIEGLGPWRLGTKGESELSCDLDLTSLKGVERCWDEQPTWVVVKGWNG